MKKHNCKDIYSVYKNAQAKDIASMTATILSNTEKLMFGMFIVKFEQRFGRDIINKIRKFVSDLESHFTPKNITDMKAVMRTTEGSSVQRNLPLTLEMTINGRLLCNNGDGLQINVNLATVFRVNRLIEHEETWRITAEDVECVLPNGTVITCNNGYVRPFEGKLLLHFFNNSRGRRRSQRTTTTTAAPSSFWIMVTNAKKRVAWPRLTACTDCCGCYCCDLGAVYNDDAVSGVLQKCTIITAASADEEEQDHD